MQKGLDHESPRVQITRLTTEQRVDLVLFYYTCRRNITETLKQFQRKHPEHPQLSVSALNKLVRKFRLDGDVWDGEPRNRPPKRVDDESLAYDIMHGIRLGGLRPMRDMAKLHCVPFSRIRTIMQERYDELDSQDRLVEIPKQRYLMCNRFFGQVDITKTLFTDECVFYLDGSISMSQFWTIDEPRWIHFSKPHRKVKVIVWAGMMGNKLVGPIFFKDFVTERMYYEVLWKRIIPQIRRTFPDIQRHWFMHDNAPPHRSDQIHFLLNRTFGGLYIGPSGVFEWPAKSADLHPIGFFLWGYLQSVVYQSHPIDAKSLRAGIEMAMRNIPQETLEQVQQACLRRMHRCVRVGGFFFEHML